jgi:hypothetical protein
MIVVQVAAKAFYKSGVSTARGKSMKACTWKKNKGNSHELMPLRKKPVSPMKPLRLAVPYAKA